MRVLKWIASNKEFLDEQLLRLWHLIDTMWKLATIVSERVRENYVSRADAILTRDESHLMTVAVMTFDQYLGIVKAAQVKQGADQRASAEFESAF